ncbi:MAG: hypothetical protein IJ087_09880 [Eggerthellaceae bacterium]|nr:hypothetical protein [Eggerthellaceae bacterium]
MSKKQRKKVKLPRDRNGVPIGIGDIIAWDDGTTMRVAVLNYYGDGCWTVWGEGEEDSDNIDNSKVVWKKGW